MPRYVAFLRGVSPQNAKMPELKRAFESAGFTEVRTLLSSGNVVFNTRKASDAAIAKRAEEAMQAELGRSFGSFIRSTEFLQDLLASDPFAAFGLPPESKRVMTFLNQPPAMVPKLPITLDEATILQCVGAEVFSAYVPGPKGPTFMVLLERTFGKDITTRTLATVQKCAVA
ncbi:MAG: DUF1697 domain-containing protein [Rhodoferax sp.]|nr:DUF1697 domain-containing protein [Rhodoferax sp.]